MSHIHHECELERHIVEQRGCRLAVGKSADYDQEGRYFPRMCCWLEDSQPQAMAKILP